MCSTSRAATSSPPPTRSRCPPIDLKPGFNIDNAARIRRETGMPTIGVGRINTPELAEKILKDDQVDLVVMGRAQLADPEFCNKAREGNTDSIVYSWAATRAAWTALPTCATSAHHLPAQPARGPRA